MKSNVRIFSLALAMAMLLSLFALPVSAETLDANVEVEISNASPKVGDEITVIVKNTDMTVSSFITGVRFDNAKLECKKIVGPDSEYPDEFTLTRKNGRYVYATAAPTISNANSQGVVSVAFAGTSDVEYAGGKLFTATFKVIAEGDSPIVLFENSDGAGGIKNDAVVSTQVSVAKPAVLVTNITLNESELSLTVGDAPVALSVTKVEPDNASDKTVTWKSSNETVATVDTNGKVTAGVAGTATITATANDGSGVNATCAVTVTEITLAEDTLELYLAPDDNTATLTATVTPDNVKVKWSVESGAAEGIISIEEDSSDSRKVTVKANKTGSATLLAEAEDGSGASAFCYITVKPARTYAVTLSPASVTFFDAIFGYSAQEPVTVTVTNNGNQPTGALTVTIDNSDAFALSKTTIDSLGVEDSNKTGTFTVQPKNGLAVGTYTAKVTVSGANGISAEIPVSFTVSDVPTYAITLDKAEVTLESAVEGYTTVPYAEIKVSSTGNQPTGALIVTVSNSNFKVSPAALDTIASGSNATFTIQPMTGLAIGTYKGTVTVAAPDSNANKDKITPQTVEITFVVTHKHKFDEAIEDEAHLKAKGKDCNTANEYWRECSYDGCSVISDTEFFTSTTKFGDHKYSTEWTSDDTSHWHQCENNSAHKTDIGYHDESTVPNDKYIVPGEEGSCKDGKAPKYYKYCSTCGKAHTDTFDGTVPRHDYEDVPYTQSKVGDIEYHNRNCKACGTPEFASNSDANKCSGGSATCTDKAVCVTCANSYGTTVIHNYSSEWSFNETHHWHACANGNPDCTSVSDYHEHVPGPEATEESAQYCTVCNYEITPKLEPAFDEDMLMILIMMMNKKYDVVAEAGEGGVITPAGENKVKFNKSISFDITPAEGYVISAVLVDGKDVGPVTEYTFKNVRTDHTISVVFEKAPWVNPFTDVTENDWFYEDVKFVSETGLMNGNSADGKLFDPSVITNRAMLVTILWRLEGCPTVSSSVKFTDVDANAWYADAVNWASANDIILGDETGAFGANDELTREQAALILYRYAAYKGVIEGSATADSTELKASDWAKDAVIWAEANGLLKGIGVDTSDMTKGISRAEIAAYLRRFCENFLAK